MSPRIGRAFPPLLSFESSRRTTAMIKNHCMKRQLVFIALLLVSCQTTTRTTNRLSIGMTQAEVVRAVGKPFSKSAEVIHGVQVERWVYKETTWDQGGWSWNRTVSDSEVVFRSGRVISFGVANERHL